MSEVGATLQVEATIEGLALKEFFLLLSSTGLAYRRCQLDRVNGEELEVSFLRLKSKEGDEISGLIPQPCRMPNFPGNGTFCFCALCNVQRTCERWGKP